MNLYSAVYEWKSELLRNVTYVNGVPSCIQVGLNFYGISSFEPKSIPVRQIP